MRGRSCLGPGAEVVGSVRGTIATLQGRGRAALTRHSSLLFSVCSQVFHLGFYVCLFVKLGCSEHFQTLAPLRALCVQNVPLSAFPTPVTKKQ